MKRLLLDSAMLLLNSCLKEARDKGTPPLSIVILDEGGQVKTSASEDGSGILRMDIALGKAYAALGMGFNTRQFHSLVKDGILPEMFSSAINGAANGKFVPLPGGVLIRNQQETIGAIGISGASSDLDEAIAISGIKANGYRYS